VKFNISKEWCAASAKTEAETPMNPPTHPQHCDECDPSFNDCWNGGLCRKAVARHKERKALAKARHEPSATPRTATAAAPLTEWRKLPDSSNLLLVDANLCEALETELARLRAEVERLKASANHHRDLGITLLDAKWLDPECHTGCQSLIWKARAERAEAQLAAIQSP